MQEPTPQDTTPDIPWVYWIGDCCIPLPKLPMLNAGLGPPPFWVKTPMGEDRYVVYAPDDFERRRGA